MPTGFYKVLEKKNNFIKDVRYSKEAVQWLEHVMERDNVQIRHAENGGEERIKNYYVDGFDEENNTVSTSTTDVIIINISVRTGTTKRYGTKRSSVKKTLEAKDTTLYQSPAVNG